MVSLSDAASTGDIRAAETFCRQYARSQYENFTKVSWFVPRRLRPDFYNVYAFCRASDDLADESGSPAAASEKLARWRKALAARLDGAAIAERPPADDRILVAVAATLRRRKLRSEPLFDLLSAFEQDQHLAQYQDWGQLQSYCDRSANPVGRIVLGLADAGDNDNVRRSDLICTALQQINFCQDMARDAAIGRIYMPAEHYQRWGIDTAEILAAHPTPALRQSLAAWVQRIRPGFLAGWSLGADVPRWLGRNVRLFASGGLAVCEAIAAQEYDVWTARPVVSQRQKVRLLLRNVVTSRPPSSRAFDAN